MSLQDTDLLYVARGNRAYKMPASEFIKYIPAGGVDLDYTPPLQQTDNNVSFDWDSINELPD